MTAINPAEFYKANIDKEKEYVWIFSAYEVRAGEEMQIGYSRLTADKDGYEINGAFMSKDVFAAQTASAEDLELALSKKDLGEEGILKIEPIKKGERFRTDIRYETVDRDGFIITKKNGQSYMSNFELTSRFNYAGRKYETQKETIVTLNDNEPVKGIILDEEIIFDFGGRACSAKAGVILTPDPGCEDGYHLNHLNDYYPLNTHLRVSPAFTERRLQDESIKNGHATALKKQARLNARASRFKLK